VSRDTRPKGEYAISVAVFIQAITTIVAAAARIPRAAITGAIPRLTVTVFVATTLSTAVAATTTAAPTAATQQAIVRSGSFGYAGLPFIYLIAHRAWWHLLAILVGSVIPMVNIGVYLWYVVNVRRLVLSTRKFESFDQYRAVQQAWDKAGRWVLAIGLLVIIARIFFK